MSGNVALARLLMLRQINAWLAEPQPAPTCWRCKAALAEEAEHCPSCDADRVPF